MTLRGPAHPDQFRIKVGRYKERFYYDPLSACERWSACDESWPAVSRIAKAASKDWSFVSIRRLADWNVTPKGVQFLSEPHTQEEMRDQYFTVNKQGIGKAMERGNSIHKYLDAQTTGEFVKVIPDAVPYLPAIDQFLADCQPEWVLSEVVIINRTLGYGGTGDAIAVKIPGLGSRFVDWKTRTSADQHAAYDEECEQVDAYAHGEYMIVEQDGQAVRMPMPELDGGLIVSLAPEGYKLYPFDFGPAWESFQALHAFWSKRRAAPYAGKPVVVPRAVPAKADPDEVAKLKARTEWIKEHSPTGLAMLAEQWPEGVPTFKDGGPRTADDVTALALVLSVVMREADVPFHDEPQEPPTEPEPKPEPEPAAAVRTSPDEGELVSQEDYDALQDEVAKLSTADHSWVLEMAAQARTAGAPISLKQKQSVRRFEIIRGLCLIAPSGGDETVRALAAAALNDDNLTAPSLPAGATLAALDATSAATFALLCEAYASGERRTVAGTDGVLRLSAA